MPLSKQHKAENSKNLLPKTAINNGWLSGVEQHKSDFFSTRCQEDKISLLVIHNISLPAGVFGTNHISELFLGKIDPNAHPSFADLAQLKVSAHCLIRRDGSIIQYVSFDDNAWHAGISIFNNREKCNDFSIGIELEGTVSSAFEEKQYLSLIKVISEIKTCYPKVTDNNIIGHSMISPERKNDPGKYFDWKRIKGEG